MSAASEAAKQTAKAGAKQFTKLVTNLWRGSGKPEVKAVPSKVWSPEDWFTPGKAPVTPTAPTTGILSRAKDVVWDNRSPWQRALIGTAAVPALPLVPKVAAGALGAYGNILKNAYGFGGPSTPEVPFDVSQIKTPEEQFAANQQSVYDLLGSYGQQPSELLALTQALSPTGNVGASGGNVQSGFTKQQIAAQNAAAEGGGTSTGTSTPVAGNLAATLDSFGPAGQYAQQKMNQYQAAANAAGVKLGNDWRQKYMMGLVADATARQDAANKAILEQRLADASTIAAMKQKGTILPDMSKIQAKASEYNNLDSNSKAYLAARGIRSAADYVNNYVNTIQG